MEDVSCRSRNVFGIFSDICEIQTDAFVYLRHLGIVTTVTKVI